jgi:Transcription factor zinc-finger
MQLPNCPQCQNGLIENTNGQLQVCPYCDGTWVDPGVESFRIYLFDVLGTVLTANAVLTNLSVVIDGGASFRLKALAGTQTGAYRVRFRHASGEYMSSGGIGQTNDLVNNANIIGTAQAPFPVIPFSLYGPSGQILLDIEDLSAAQNTVQIAFIGANVYPSPRK